MSAPTDHTRPGLSPVGPYPSGIRRGACALALLVLGTACGGDGAEEAPPEPDPFVSTESPRESMTEVDYGEFDPSEVALSMPWTRNTISRDPDPEHAPARLTDVSTSRSRGYDRVVFSFSPELPGYRFTQTAESGGGCDGTEPLSDAPGHVVVEFTRAVSNEGGSPLVGDRNRSTDFPALADAVQACDQDDTVRWILGTSGVVDYRILEIMGEPRLVVDLRHP
ncbi:MAG: hypothetical protein F4106_04890 [Gemmatimonadetes bacterium]|nr:hypothetical protein [Gemmatimonadota bacterium]